MELVKYEKTVYGQKKSRFSFLCSYPLIDICIVNSFVLKVQVILRIVSKDGESLYIWKIWILMIYYVVTF